MPKRQKHDCLPGDATAQSGVVRQAITSAEKEYTTMMQQLLRSLPVIGFTLVGSAFPCVLALADADSLYEVTVTNLNQGQALTPALVFTHDKEFAPLFTEGSPASAELAAVAEDGDIRPLRNLVATDPHVSDVAVIQGTAPLPLPPAGPGGFAIKPGESASVTVKFSSNKRWVSLVGMLASTNDAFYALNKSAGPSSDVVTYYSVAWDAGSEVNNENCQFIPGPPCGTFFARATAGAEGFVHVHPGIHGISDLVPALHDWRNPVAKITIRRLSSER
jgi:hypothetical protein